MFKKIRLYLLYRKTLKANISLLREKFVLNNKNESYLIKNIDIDWLCRVYTVLNFLPQTQENNYKYGYRFLDNEVKKFIIELETELKNMGLFELYGLSKADQIDQDKVHIIIEFKPFNTVKFARRLILGGLLVLIAGIITLIKII